MEIAFVISSHRSATEFQATHITCVRFFTCVFAFMDFELGFASKRLLACAAPKCMRPVRSHVNSEISVVIERFETDFTFVRLHTGVSASVLIKIPLSLE